jgi:hypothetical protein
LLIAASTTNWRSTAVNQQSLNTPAAQANTNASAAMGGRDNTHQASWLMTGKHALQNQCHSNSLLIGTLSWQHGVLHAKAAAAPGAYHALGGWMSMQCALICQKALQTDLPVLAPLVHDKQVSDQLANLASLGLNGGLGANGTHITIMMSS